eukprot:GFUD01120435.1.p1 GENE.GFUD01120435.1~~GFUD01120435.1.p1  ORF type:complete len:711 (+),score=250.43 GFUD01120435.1:40-2172(+)
MSPTATKDPDSKDDGKVSKSEKRKKSDSSIKAEKEPVIKQPKQEKSESIYDEILKLENRESEARPAEKDLELWKETCGELRSLMKDIFELKTKNSSPSEVTEKRIQASLLFVTLKKLNRLEKLRIKRSRDATNQSKQSVDSFNLQLQNLLYEVLHLKKEVTKCVHFKSADESLSLIPTDKFYEEAPASVSCPDVTETDEHALRLARLQWELARRRELGEEAEQRESERDRLDGVIRSKDDKLRELGPQLASILSSTVPVQDYLGMPLSDRREQLSLARLLPSPLYILYTQCQAYSEACDKEVLVRVKGDGEEARMFRETKGEDEDSQEDVKDDSQDQEGEGDKMRRSKSVRGGDKAGKVLSVHPLQVELVVSSGEDKVFMSFHWLVVLGVVTVTVTLTTKDKVEGEALSPTTLLSHLYPGDSGLLSPNHSNIWQLAAAGLADSWDRLLPDKLPYCWAQRLAGLEFLSVKPVEEGDVENGVKVVPSVDLSNMNVETTITSIRARLVARLDLQKQLDSLSQSKLSQLELLPAVLSSQFPVRVVSRLKSWHSSDWEKYSMEECTKHLTSCGVVDSDCTFFKAVVTRDKAVLTALVSIAPSYPVDSPVFCLSLQLDNNTDSLETSEMLRDLEREVNLGWEEQLGQVEGGLLLAMLHRLLVLLDVLLEVKSSMQEGVGETGSNFTKSQVFFDTVKGKMRRLPLQYNSSQQMFQQR